MNYISKLDFASHIYNRALSK